MAVVTDPEYLQIDTACIGYHFFIVPAMFLNVLFFYFPVGDMDIL